MSGPVGEDVYVVCLCDQEPSYIAGSLETAMALLHKAVVDYRVSGSCCHVELAGDDIPREGRLVAQAYDEDGPIFGAVVLRYSVR